MVKVFINDIEEQMNLIWYHYRMKPKIGGHKYSFHISLSEEKIIRKLVDIIAVEFDNPSFCNVLKTFDDSFYNPITQSLNLMEREQRLKINEVKWVLNNIHAVYIDVNFLIIEGDASEYVLDY